MSEVNLNSFPKSRAQALTMLYLEKMDLSDLTPEQLVDKYEEVYSAIQQRISDNRGKTFSF